LKFECSPQVFLESTNDVIDAILVVLSMLQCLWRSIAMPKKLSCIVCVVWSIGLQSINEKRTGILLISLALERLKLRVKEGTANVLHRVMILEPKLPIFWM
jgi:hypothetical protein